MQLVWVGGFDVVGGDGWEKLEASKKPTISGFLNFSFHTWVMMWANVDFT